MKSLKEQIAKYQPTLSRMLESKSPVEISQILELKKFISVCENKTQYLDEEEKAKLKLDILPLKLSLKILKSEHSDLEEMQSKLRKYLIIMEKEATQSPKIMQNFAKKIQYLENFIASLRFIVEDKSKIEKSLMEMDILLLEYYIDLTKDKYIRLLKKEDSDPPTEQKKHTALIEFTQSLKFHSENDCKGKPDVLNNNIKKICQYLLNNPQLYCELAMNEATYISKENTQLAYTVQIKNTEDGLQLYVSLKRKIEDWMRSGSYKFVKKNIMLIKGVWVDGVDAVVYGKKGSQEDYDKINLTLKEVKMTETLNPLYVHKIEPAAAYTHEDKYKHSFVSRLADGSLQDFIHDEKHFQSIDINKIFILAYSMTSCLAYIHSDEVGIAHLDVKADNFLVFIDSTGIPFIKISDFGLSYKTSDLKDSHRVKAYDMERMAITCGELLKEFSKTNPENQNNPILEDLVFLMDSISSSPAESRLEASQAMDILNGILEKMENNDEASPGGLVKEKLEKYYQNPLSKHTENLSLISGFFSQPRSRRSTESSIDSYHTPVTGYSS